MNRVVSYVVAGNNMGIGRNRRKERVSLIIGAGYWTNGIGWIIFDSLHLRLPLNVHSSVLLSTFAHSPQCLPPSSATPSPGQSTGVRTFKAPQNTKRSADLFLPASILRTTPGLMLAQRRCVPTSLPQRSNGEGADHKQTRLHRARDCR